MQRVAHSDAHARVLVIGQLEQLWLGVGKLQSARRHRSGEAHERLGIVQRRDDPLSAFLSKPILRCFHAVGSSDHVI